MADDGLLLVLRHKLLGTREGNLVDVAVYLLHRHTDTSVGDCQCLLLLVYRHADSEVAQLTLGLTLR